MGNVAARTLPQVTGINGIKRVLNSSRTFKVDSNFSVYDAYNDVQTNDIPAGSYHAIDHSPKAESLVVPVVGLDSNTYYVTFSFRMKVFDSFQALTLPTETDLWFEQLMVPQINTFKYSKETVDEMSRLMAEFSSAKLHEYGVRVTDVMLSVSDDPVQGWEHQLQLNLDSDNGNLTVLEDKIAQILLMNPQMAVNIENHMKNIK